MKIKGKSKRNLIILGAVALVAGAIFLNWVLFANNADPYVPNDPTGNITEAPGNQVSTPDSNESYFAMAQLNRETAYDSAYNTLISVMFHVEHNRNYYLSFQQTKRSEH